LKPRVFIGSSTESLKIAEAVHYNLEYVAEVTPWSQGIFNLSETSLDSLINALHTFDFGVFIFSEDDIVTIRGEAVSAPRDNIVFELGLFIGSLGKNRCFIITPRNSESLHLPTDLLGFTNGTYDANRSDSNWKAALTYACVDLKESIERIGKRTSNI
jgi:predicted nucleotide-binding protein